MYKSLTYAARCANNYTMPHPHNIFVSIKWNMLYLFSDYLIIVSIRTFVFLLTSLILLAEILSGGVGTFLLYNLLTGIPLSQHTMKGYSGKVLSGMFEWDFFDSTKKINFFIFPIYMLFIFFITFLFNI